LKAYDKEFDLLLQELESIEEITEDEAKTIMVSNTEYDEDNADDSQVIALYDLSINNDFAVIASNEF